MEVHCARFNRWENLQWKAQGLGCIDEIIISMVNGGGDGSNPTKWQNKTCVITNWILVSFWILWLTENT